MLDEVVKVRIEAAEKVAFQATATEEGLTLSEWLRRLGRERIEDRWGHLLQVGVSPSNGDGHDDANFSWD